MYPQIEIGEAKGPQVTLHTTMGDIKFQLFEDQAPKTVANFVGLAKNGYYDGVSFHRVIADFMIQGGDPTGTGAGGESIYGQTFEDEFSDKLFNFRGALSMANAGPNTNGSQFFIVQASRVPSDMIEQLKGMGLASEVIAKYEQGGTPWLDGHHTVFGQIIEGMDVVDEMAKVSTNYEDRPDTPILINSVSVSEA
ncbi:peptidylprolyl isomerase [Furfurilactobacillus rossiae]|uniref:Peptidyl-prolyl cis-trans isomerase n=1 Tax=Furfurilactobacillus rossiae DSM 15814 TaxID=1114972 RepID=A0A0R1RH71_9LACO|nr:peptidylprolyl isomerase [Furfurilactobacillus rossiae]KRL54122.1 peptidyl-prolyl cis-trans isomerase [Furfurilactobacillus rossiae DSM 15814]QFR66282.1 peptidylprolyl isomerase [Furfurilactobacillus rossiae]QLE61728.1 Peptidyl-prolyl cis-trans isomerase [Furfurilactobacillus rossiae]